MTELKVFVKDSDLCYIELNWLMGLMIGVFFMDEREMINKKKKMEGTNPKEMELCQETESVKEETPQEKGKENKDVSENTDFISAGKKKN